MTAAVIVAVVTGLTGVISSLMALISQSRKNKDREYDHQRQSLYRQADQVQDGFKKLLADTISYYEGRIADMNEDLQTSKAEITRLKGGTNGS